MRFANRNPKSPTGAGLLALALLLLPACTGNALAQDLGLGFDEFHFSSNLGLEYTEGNYGTARNTNVEIALPSVSMETGNLKFSASMPYMRISGRGLVIFDAAGNPIVINRNTSAPPDVRTGWGDLNLSASYTIPGAVMNDFEVRLTGIAKLPTGPGRRRLNTGEADFGVTVDVSRKIGDWGPFLTVGYLAPGQPTTFQLYDTTSVSVGTTYEISDKLVAVASYDFDTASTPLVPASHGLFGSLSWVRDDNVTLTGYTTAGLSSGAPDFGAGLLISYGFD